MSKQRNAPSSRDVSEIYTISKLTLLPSTERTRNHLRISKQNSRWRGSSARGRRTACSSPCQSVWVGRHSLSIEGNENHKSRAAPRVSDTRSCSCVLSPYCGLTGVGYRRRPLACSFCREGWGGQSRRRERLTGRGNVRGDRLD